MYKSKDKQRKVVRKAVAKHRQGITLGITTPAIVRAIVNKRPMLEYISEDLNRKHLGDQLRYGIGGPTFEVIDKLLEATA